MLNPEKSGSSSSFWALTEHQLRFMRKYTGKVDNVKYRNGKRHYFQFLQQTKTTESYDGYVKNLLELSYIQRTLKISSVKYYRDISNILNGRSDQDQMQLKSVDQVVQSLREIIEANSRRNSEAVQNQQKQEVIEIVQMDDVLNSMTMNKSRQADQRVKQIEQNKKKMSNQAKKQGKTFYKSYETSLEDAQIALEQNEQEYDSFVAYQIRSTEFLTSKMFDKRPKQIKDNWVKRTLSDKSQSVCVQPSEADKQVTIVSSNVCRKQTKILQELQRNFLYRKHHQAHLAKQEKKNSPEKQKSIPQTIQKHRSFLPLKSRRSRISYGICNKIFQFIKSILFQTSSNDQKCVLPPNCEQNKSLIKKQQNKKTSKHNL